MRYTIQACTSIEGLFECKAPDMFYVFDKHTEKVYHPSLDDIRVPLTLNDAKFVACYLNKKYNLEEEHKLKREEEFRKMALKHIETMSFV